MKNRYLPFFCFMFIFFLTFNFLCFAQWFNWVKKAGGTSAESGNSISTDAYGNSYDYGNSISIDANGNSYVTGQFRGTATFGSIQLVSNGIDDIFIAKYDASGNCVWAKNAGGIDYDNGNSISTDAYGNSYVTGYFEGTATFGTIQLVSYGNEDIFIAKYDVSGNCVWAKNAGGIDYDNGRGISTDANGNSYVTGGFQQTATFDTYQLVSYGEGDIFIAKYDNNGICSWVKQAGGTSGEGGSGISTDLNGNSYITGGFQETVTFGTIQLVSSGLSDIFIAKYDVSGNCVWAKRAGGSVWDRGYGISVDANGNSYITGEFWGTATFGTIQLVSSGESDIFIAGYDIDGNCIWAKRAGGGVTDSEEGLDISIDDYGNYYITGNFDGTVIFGTIQLIGYGDDDIFIAKLSTSQVYYNRIEFYTNVGINSGNPNNYLTPGKFIRFKLRIKNDFTTNLLTGYGTIRCLSPVITVTDSQATYNNVLSGQDSWSVDDYEIYVPNTIPYGSQISFLLTVTQAIPPTGPWSSIFSFPIAPLRVEQIFLDDDQNPDSWGNNNKIPEPGETIEVIPLLKNISSQTIYKTSGRLATDLAGITIWDSLMGVSGFVYDTWRYNVSSGVPQPIPTGSTGIQPEQDYVFDYANITPYPSLLFNLYYNAYLGGNPGGSWQTGGILIKWGNPFYMADGIVSSLEESASSEIIPSKTQLHQNYPNPFNPSTSINYQIPEMSFVTLKVYDVLGNEIATLVSEVKSIGSYEAKFEATGLPSGVYFYQLKAGSFVQTKKMVLMK